jgi:hypothetical protein
MRPGRVRFADQREMPVADLPPIQPWMPSHAKVEFLDVMIAHADGNLHADRACERTIRGHE